MYANVQVASSQEIFDSLQAEVSRLKTENSAMWENIMDGRDLMRELASAVDGAVLAGEVFPETLNEKVGEWMRRNPHGRG